MRKNASLLGMTLVALLPLPGCVGIGGPYMSSGSPTGADPYKDGFIQILPTSLTLRVNERRTVVANLDGPIAYFVRFDWTVSPSSMELTPRPCSGLANDHRECGVEITAVAPGEAKLTFTASLGESFFDVSGSLRVTILP